MSIPSYHCHFAFKAILLIILVYSSLVYSQSIPQIQPNNSTLGASTSYTLNYFSSKQILSTTKFTVDFSNSYIAVPSGSISCTIYLNGIAVSNPTCNCTVTSTSKVCQMKPNKNQAQNTRVQIIFGGLTNPYFLSTALIPVTIYFSPSLSTENYTVSIQNVLYKPMPITINSFKQSQYGVGSTPVTYTFNLSLHYISNNFQMQLQIPEQVSFNSLTSQLSFYGTIQDIHMMQIQSLLIFNIMTPTIKEPTGYMILVLHGFGNPQFIGNSSSFKVTFVQMQAVRNCANCKIAEVRVGLVAESKTPGDISVMSFTSTDLYIASVTNISINLQLYAGVPIGGKISIYLPDEIAPVIPISCSNIYGFEITDGNQPHCTYNQAQNRIDTNNFAFPFLVSIGNGIISLKLHNPSDTRNVQFRFQTYDNQGRTIGQSRQQYNYSAIPLQMSLKTTKSNNQVDSSYSLTCQITLQRQITPTSDKIQLIFPSNVNYNLSAISCIAAQQNLNCSATLNDIGQLVVMMKPPCVSCMVGNVIRFGVDGLKNPSYIAEDTQVIYVHTRSNGGIIEASRAMVMLVPAQVDLLEYKVPIGQVVGAQYDLQVKLRVPDYVVANGGQIHIIFAENTVYCDPSINQTNNNLLNYTPTLTIQSLTNTLPNNIQYHPTTPPSISRITIPICTPSSSSSTCTPNLQLPLKILHLKQPYLPSLVTNTHTIKITTILNQLISQKQIDMSTSSPVLANNLLQISLNPDITNVNSEYTISFVVDQVVIERQLEFVFGLDQQIQAGLCQFTTDYYVGISYVCTKLADNVIKVEFDLDQGYMIGNTIRYTLVVGGVKTPHSMKPRAYQLSTKFMGSKNQQYVQTVAVAQPYPLNMTLQMSNNTIGQQCMLTVTASPKTQNYNSFTLFIDKSILTITSSNALAHNYTFTENSTHYILKQPTNKLPLSNKTTLLTHNTLSTITTGSIRLTTYDSSSYKVQSKQLAISPRQPLILGYTISSSNRTVGMLTNLTITIDRNNVGGYAENKLLVVLSKDGFMYDYAMYGGLKVGKNGDGLYVVEVGIGAGTKRVIEVVVSDVRNMMYVSDGGNVDAIVVMTKRDVEVVGVVRIPSKDFVPNKVYYTDCTAMRSSTKSGDITNISIVYQQKYAKQGDIMTLRLPQGQNSYVSSSGCYIDNQPCTILSQNTSTITIEYTPNKTILLTNILNYHPNPNPLLISLHTPIQSSPIQSSTTTITPPISLQYLHIQSSASTPVVGVTNTLQFAITSTQLPIQPSQFLIIQMPAGVFTRDLVVSDCSVIVNGFTYTGCQYGMLDGYVDKIRVGSFGPIRIQKMEVFRVRVFVRNPWAAYSFGTKTIRFMVYKNETTALSQGLQPLAQIFSSLSSFKPQPITKQPTTTTNLTANSHNNLTLTYTLSSPILTSTAFLTMIPKDTYTLPSTTTLTITKQDINYYYTTTPFIQTNCLTWSQSPTICTKYQFRQMLPLINNKYTKISNNNDVVSYGVVDGYQISQLYAVGSYDYVALKPERLLTTRSSDQAYSDTVVKVVMDIGGYHGPVTLSFTNTILYDIHQIDCYQSTTTSANNKNKLDIVRNDNNPLYNVISINNYSGNMLEVVISGQNVLEVPNAGIKYGVMVSNLTHLLYKQDAVTFPQQLIPYSRGLSLTRTNTTVSQITNLTLLGTLPPLTTTLLTHPLNNNNNYTIKILSESYPNYTTTPLTNTLSLLLNPYTNPSTIHHPQTISCTISNNTHTIYHNSSLTITPQLTSIVSNQVSIVMPGVVYVQQVFNVTVLFGGVEKYKAVYSVEVDGFFEELLKVVGYYEDGGREREVVLMGAVERVDDSVRVQVSKDVQHSQFKVHKIVMTVKAIQYQHKFAPENSIWRMDWQAPSTHFQTPINITVIGKQLTSTVTPNSLRTSATTSYTINITSLSKSGSVQISLPPYISSLLMPHTLTNIASTSTLTINTAQTPLSATSIKTSPDSTLYFSIPITSPTPTLICLTLQQIVNPPDNRTLSFEITQQQSADQIYGRSVISVQMQQFDPIYVYEARRNNTKIDEWIQLDVSIYVSDYGVGVKYMDIALPYSQVVVQEGVCYVEVDGVQKQCQSVGNRIRMQSVSGNHTYTFRNIKNAQFVSQPEQLDKIQITLTTPNNHNKVAQTTPQTTTHITPSTISGTILLTNLTTTNQIRSQYTTLSLTIQPQNWQSCQGIIINFYQYAYYLHHNIMIYVDQLQVAYVIVNSTCLFVQVVENREKMRVEIRGIINYYQSGGIQMYTVKRKQGKEGVGRLLQGGYVEDMYGLMDSLYVQASGIVFVAAQPSTRIIFPNNYLSQQPERVIIAITDSQLPTQLPTTSLLYNFTSPQLSCHSTIPYNQTITIKCNITKQGQTEFSILLYNPSLTQFPLTSYSTTIQIHGMAHNQCNNVMCDLCTGTGQDQLCFECREGLLVEDGQCVQECFQGFGYMGVCVQCAPQCQECYDLYGNSCLECKDQGMVVDSGVCVQECVTHSSFEYQGYCVNQKQCQHADAQGCRICSSTGFCYQCLPEYSGQPSCQPQQLLPPTFFTFFIIPFLLLLIITTAISCYKVGFQTYPNLLIYMLAVVQFFTWIFTVPRIPQQAIAMLLLSLILLRIINSIISYQLYYNKVITNRKESRLLHNNQQDNNNRNIQESASDPETQHPDRKKANNNNKVQQSSDIQQIQDIQAITCKERLCRFTGHFLSSDSYQLLQSKISNPYLTITHHSVFMLLNIINRVIIMCVLAYIVTMAGSIVDLLIVPVIAMSAGFVILMIRMVKSDCCGRVMDKFRGN